MQRILVNVLSGFLLLTELRAQPSQESRRPGDDAFESLNYQLAETKYDSLLYVMPEDSAAVLWRKARVHICMGDVEEGKQSERHYRLAERYAHRSVQLDSMSGDARTWYAAALGSVALHEGGRTKVRLAWDIKRLVEDAIALNANNDIAYSILGSFHRALAGLSWIERQLAAIFVGKLPEGSYEDGERALKRAIAINPRAARHYYELGLLYLDWGKPRLARQMLSKVPLLPIAVARDVQNKADAERRLEELTE